MALTQIADAGLKTPASDLQDSEKIILGTGNDLQIYHDGSNSYIQHLNTGNLKLMPTTGDIIIDNGSGELGRFTQGGDWELPDDGKFVCGTGDDLQIYHDGSHSRLVNGTGELFINSSLTKINNAANNAAIAHFTQAGSVDLYYNGTKKFETKDYGVFIDGHIQMDDDDIIKLGNGNDLQLLHDGSASIIKHTHASNDLYIQCDNIIHFTDVGANETFLKLVDDGAVELYHNNILKLTTLSSGVQMANGSGNNNLSLFDSDKISCGNDGDLKVYHDGASKIVSTSPATLYIASDQLQITNAGITEAQAKFFADGACELNYNNVKKFETTSAGCKVSTGVLDFDDSVEARFGTGNDLKIYHDGSHSRIVDAGTGDLKIQTNSLQLLNAAGDEYFLYGVENGSVSLYHNNVQKVETQSDGVTIGGHLRPWSSRDDTDDCGRPGARWDDIYATNTTIQTSDRNEKEAITASDLGLAFINKLTPVSFKRKGKTRTHYGLIAQDIETVLTNISKTTTQFAGFIKSDISEKQDGSSYRYGLRMGEFTAPLIKAVQELSAEVDTLKTKVAALEAA